MEPVSL